MRLLTCLIFATLALAQSSSQWDDSSGMYTFLHEGEFVQITIEHGELSGFISRHGDTSTDKGQTIDQPFEEAQLDGNHLSFKTRFVHGEGFSFDGTISRAENKGRNGKGFYVVRGTLTRTAGGKSSPKQVTLRSLPESIEKQ